MSQPVLFKAEGEQHKKMADRNCSAISVFRVFLQEKYSPLAAEQCDLVTGLICYIGKFIWYSWFVGPSWPSKLQRLWFSDQKNWTNKCEVGLTQKIVYFLKLTTWQSHSLNYSPVEVRNERGVFGTSCACTWVQNCESLFLGWSLTRHQS